MARGDGTWGGGREMARCGRAAPRRAATALGRRRAGRGREWQSKDVPGSCRLPPTPFWGLA